MPPHLTRSRAVRLTAAGGLALLASLLGAADVASSAAPAGAEEPPITVTLPPETRPEPPAPVTLPPETRPEPPVTVTLPPETRPEPNVSGAAATPPAAGAVSGSPKYTG